MSMRKRVLHECSEVYVRAMEQYREERNELLESAAKEWYSVLSVLSRETKGEWLTGKQCAEIINSSSRINFHVTPQEIISNFINFSYDHNRIPSCFHNCPKAAYEYFSRFSIEKKEFKPRLVHFAEVDENGEVVPDGCVTSRTVIPPMKFRIMPR